MAAQSNCNAKGSKKTLDASQEERAAPPSNSTNTEEKDASMDNTQRLQTALKKHETTQQEKEARDNGESQCVEGAVASTTKNGRNGFHGHDGRDRLKAQRQDKHEENLLVSRQNVNGPQTKTQTAQIHAEEDKFKGEEEEATHREEETKDDKNLKQMPVKPGGNGATMNPHKQQQPQEQQDEEKENEGVMKEMRSKLETLQQLITSNSSEYKQHYENLTQVLSNAAKLMDEQLQNIKNLLIGNDKKRAEMVQESKTQIENIEYENEKRFNEILRELQKKNTISKMSLFLLILIAFCLLIYGCLHYQNQEQHSNFLQDPELYPNCPCADNYRTTECVECAKRLQTESKESCTQCETNTKVLQDRIEELQQMLSVSEAEVQAYQEQNKLLEGEVAECDAEKETFQREVGECHVK